MKRWLGTFTIIGTVIGAGVLGLPYAISVSGFIPGLILLLIIAACMTLLLLYLGEVVLRCKEVKQLPGLVEKYLGHKWYGLTLLMFIISIYGALMSYVVGVSGSLVNLLGGSQELYMTLFIALMSIPVLKGVHLMGKVQLILTSSLILLVIIVTLSIMPQANFTNLSFIDLDSLFFPFGVVFFALIGYSVMPELEMILLKHEEAFKPAVLTAMGLVTLIYIIITAVFIGVFDQGISQVATDSLSGTLGIIGSLIAVFGMTTSFMGLGVALSDVYKQDLKLSNVPAWALTCLIPLGINLVFKPSFIQPIQISGAYTGTLIGFLIIALWFKARKVKGVKPAYTAPFGKTGATIVGLILLGGLITTTLELFGLL